MEHDLERSQPKEPKPAKQKDPDPPKQVAVNPVAPRPTTICFVAEREA
jgi:hypothetical protein